MSSVKERKKNLGHIRSMDVVLILRETSKSPWGERNENELENGDYKEYSRLSVCRTHQHKTGKH